MNQDETHQNKTVVGLASEPYTSLLRGWWITPNTGKYIWINVINKNRK